MSQEAGEDDELTVTVIDGLRGLEKHLLQELEAGREAEVHKKSLALLLTPRVEEDNPAVTDWARRFAAAHDLVEVEDWDWCIFQKRGE